MAILARIWIVGAIATLAAGGQAARSAQERPARFTTYAEARAILERFAPEPATPLAVGPAAEQEAAWREWVERRGREMRARLERGDEDSLVNFLLFGTSFTRQPRALNDSSTLGGPQRAADVVRARIDDLVDAIAGMSTGPSARSAAGFEERLRFVRAVVERQGIDPRTAPGRDQLRGYIVGLIKRTVGEVESYARSLEVARSQGRGELAARSTLYRTRGLSSDTSIRPDFAVHQTLDALRRRKLLAPGSIRRVAIVGPGLDFTDKAEGYDFYPPQTTQPFSVIDSLLRLKLARVDELIVTTLDVSPRVNGHLRDAQRRAAEGGEYVFALPRDRGDAWAPGLVAYWRSLGGGIGGSERGMPAPAGVDVRAVRVRPEVVTRMQVRDLDIVVERLDPLPPAERFDLAIATNVLVYYDVLEQSLALANIAAMLRPGGFLLSNTVLVELPSTPIRGTGHTDAIYSGRPDDRDQVVWYRRQ